MGTGRAVHDNPDRSRLLYVSALSGGLFIGPATPFEFSASRERLVSPAAAGGVRVETRVRASARRVAGARPVCFGVRVACRDYVAAAVIYHPLGESRPISAINPRGQNRLLTLK